MQQLIHILDQDEETQLPDKSPWHCDEQGWFQATQETSTPNTRLIYMTSGVSPIQNYTIERYISPQKWKAGNKTDKRRINRYRSEHKRYHPALDVSEIFEHIMSYVVWADARSAVHFCRALETLGSRYNFEEMFLEVFKAQRFTPKIGIGSARVKIMKGDHCLDCLKRLRCHWTSENNVIDRVPRCWSCFQRHHQVVPSYQVKARLLAAGMKPHVVNRGLDTKNKCLCGSCKCLKSELRFVIYKCTRYFLRDDVKQYIKAFKAKKKDKK